MRSTVTSWASLVLTSLILLFGGALDTGASAQSFTASLSTDRGCGAGAVYNFGETIQFLFSVSQIASVTLRLQRPDGSMLTLLDHRPVVSGATYALTGVIGNPPGQRLLTLDAVAGAQTAHAECTYIAQSAPTSLSATLQTDRGCGANALYNLGEPILFSFRASQSALVTLQLRRPDGTSSVLLANQPVQAGATQQFPGVIGNPTGQRTLVLDAVAGSQTAHAECTYTAQGAAGGSLTLSLTLDHECGASYHVGQLITAIYSASADTTLTLVDQHADGTVSAIFTNQPVLAGQTYSILGVIGTDLGGRMLTLMATPGTPAAPATCRFTAVP